MAVKDVYPTVYNEKIYNEPNSILQNSKAIMNMKPRFEKIDKKQSSATGILTQGTLQKYDEELRPSTQNTNNRKDAAPSKVYDGE